MMPRPAGAGWGGGLRGAAVSSRVRDSDLAAFAATGGNVVRVMCTQHPLRELSAPYRLDQASFRRLDQILAACQRNRLQVVLDPHTFVGMSTRYTCYPTDQLWKSAHFQDLAVELWSYVARRYRSAGDLIVGYDLLNEPAVPDISANRGLASWNALARRMAAAVREQDSHTHLVIEPAVGPGPGGWHDRFSAMKYLLAPPDGRVVVSPHMYAPHSFTFQGVNGHASGYSYPGRAEGRYWDKSALAAYMEPARAYQRRHHVPVLIGEFSAARWTGADGVRYLRDNIDLFEQWGWDWTYVGWREYEGWDAELGPNPNNRRRQDSTPRMNLLRRYYGRNGAVRETRRPAPLPRRRGRVPLPPIPLQSG